MLDPTVFAEIVATAAEKLVAPGHEAPGTVILREEGGYVVVLGLTRATQYCARIGNRKVRHSSRR